MAEGEGNWGRFLGPRVAGASVWSTRVLLSAALTAAAAACLVLLDYGSGRDQWIYRVVAAVMLEGGAPYRDALDFKPPGFFAVYIGTEAGKLPRARKGIHEHIQRLLDEPVSAAEIDRAGRYLVGSFEIGLQRGGAVASRILFDELYGIGHDAMDRYPEHILSLKADDAAA